MLMYMRPAIRSAACPSVSVAFPLAGLVGLLPIGITTPAFLPGSPIATASGDPVVALVMRLILEDEERHHGLLKRIEASLRDALNWTHSPNALPASGMPEQTVASQLAAAARVLIEEERTGAHYLRGIAHLEKGIDSGLHTLLLEMMALDSEKHARLLQFVHDRLVARARTTTDQAADQAGLQASRELHRQRCQQ